MLATGMRRVTPSAIMELIKTTAGGDYLSFASGLPDPTLFPVEAVRAVADQVLSRDGAAALQYGPAEGYPPLRALVADLLRARGLAAAPEHLLITNGSQQALDLAARALLDPGAPVVIESPSYLAAIQAFDSYDARYLPLPLDEDGMQRDGLATALAAGPRLLYTLPNFQNPTGITLSAERRRRLAEAAARAGVPVLEDDAYHDLRYDGESLPTVCGLAANPHALYAGTFSKVIAPGLRVGYLWGAPALIERLAQLKQITDLHTGSLTQRIVHAFCLAGHLEPAIERFRSVYRRRRDALLAALAAELGDHATWTRPAGGMFVWVTLRPEIDAQELLTRALEAGVLFVPGGGFHPGGGGANTLRLTFVSLDEERIREGVKRLARLIRHPQAAR
jgi:2-aminoadipate transaminase